MRARTFVASALLAFITVCSSCKKAAAPQHGPATAGSAVAAGSQSASPVASGSASVDSGADAPNAPASLAATIDAAFAAAKLTLAPAPPPVAAGDAGSFLGWSKDGGRYLTRATYEIAEDLGSEGVGFSLVEVRDTLTQQVVETYQDGMWPSRKGLEQLLSEASAEEAKAVPVALWDGAKPAADRAKIGAGFIDVGKPKWGKPGPHALRTSAAGAELLATLRGKPPFRSKLVLSEAKHGYAFEWTGFAAEPDENRPAPRPAIELSAKTKAGTFPLVTATITTTYETLHDSIDTSEPTVGGEIRAYWSPTGTHVALDLLELPEGGHEEMGLGLETRSFVRAVGPQIKVVAAGASYDHARKAAAVIAHAGHPVTLVEQATSAMAGGVVYYRGDSSKLVAEAIAKLLPGLRVEALAKPGWLDLIVMLGT